MDEKAKIPRRQPDFELKHNGQNLKFWWAERIQTNLTDYGYLTVYSIDLDSFRYSQGDLDLNQESIWCEYQDFLTESDFKLAKESYINWLLETEIIKET